MPFGGMTKQGLKVGLLENVRQFLCASSRMEEMAISKLLARPRAIMKNGLTEFAPITAAVKPKCDKGIKISVAEMRGI